MTSGCTIIMLTEIGRGTALPGPCLIHGAAVAHYAPPHDDAPRILAICCRVPTGRTPRFSGGCEDRRFLHGATFDIAMARRSTELEHALRSIVGLVFAAE
jgi:hypothetical protein